MRFEKPYRFDRALQRSRQFSNRIVDFMTMRVDADLHLLHAQLSNALSFRLANHHAVGFQFDVKQQTPRVFDDFEEIAAHQHFSAAKRKKEDSSIRKLVENVQNLGRGHLAVIVMIEIAMNAPFIATVSDVEMHADGNAQPERLLIHLGQKTHAASGGDAAVMGFSETRRMPCWARSFTNISASRPACSASTSNSRQILLATISDNAVQPSAACQITEATSFSVKKVESTADMIIISPPISRAAMAELRAMYLSAITS